MSINCSNRPDEIYEADLHRVRVSADRVIAVVLLLQLVLAVVVAALLSPWTWSDATRALHPHLLLALGGGLVINAAPLYLLWKKPGSVGTRHVVAVAQVLWSALLVHVSGGRIETHFHVFASLAVLSMYRDPWLFLTATLVVSADHLVLGALVSPSVYGVVAPEWRRFLEHVFWVVLQDLALVFTTTRSLQEMRLLAQRAADAESETARIDVLVQERTCQLSESREQYRSLIETSSTVPWQMDAASGRLVYIGPQCKRMMGVSAEEMQSRAFAGLMSLVHSEDRERTAARLQRAFADGAAFEIENRLIHAETGRIVYLRSVVTAHDEGGQRVLRGFTFDVTARKRLEMELGQAQKLESVGRMAAGIAHEINTPIQYVSDNVHFLCEAVKQLTGVVDAQRAMLASVAAGSDVAQARAALVQTEQDADLDFVRSNVPLALAAAVDGLERVCFIVQSMKQLSYQDRGETVAADMNQVVMSTTTVARGEYKYVADLITELGVLPAVPCRISEINQVVLNLVLNAAHAIEERNAATPEVRGTITVRTFIEDASGHACIAVRDTGTGIDPKVRDRIFDPFFTTKPVGKGTGQGLAIARSIVVDHGGRIDVETELGQGTEVIVRLPLAPARSDREERRAA